MFRPRWQAKDPFPVTALCRRPEEMLQQAFLPMLVSTGSGQIGNRRIRYSHEILESRAEACAIFRAQTRAQRIGPRAFVDRAQVAQTRAFLTNCRF